METHKSKLEIFCRCCGGKNIDLKRKYRKENLKLHVKLLDYYFDKEDGDIHPNNVCLPCKRRLETVDKKFRNSMRKSKCGDIASFKTSIGNENFVELAIFTKHQLHCIICNEVDDNEDAVNIEEVDEGAGETSIEGDMTQNTPNIVVYKCSNCLETGHNKRRCPQLMSASDEEPIDEGEEPRLEETPKKYSNPTEIPLLSPGTPTYNLQTYKQSLEKQYKKHLETRKLKKLPFKIKVNDEFETQWVICGNFSFPIEKIKCKKVGALFKCTMCKAVSFKRPIEVSCCSGSVHLFLKFFIFLVLNGIIIYTAGGISFVLLLTQMETSGI